MKAKNFFFEVASYYISYFYGIILDQTSETHFTICAKYFADDTTNVCCEIKQENISDSDESFYFLEIKNGISEDYIEKIMEIFQNQIIQVSEKSDRTIIQIRNDNTLSGAQLVELMRALCSARNLSLLKNIGEIKKPNLQDPLRNCI